MPPWNGLNWSKTAGHEAGYRIRVAPSSSEVRARSCWESRTARCGFETRLRHTFRLGNPEGGLAPRYCTVTEIAADVVTLPATSVALAVSVCLPLAALRRFQLTL
jgi:hypothetical protein